jgi:hypothetical protein
MVPKRDARRVSSAIPCYFLLTVALSGVASVSVFLRKRRRPVVVVAVHPVSGTMLTVTRYAYVTAYWVGALGVGVSLLLAAWYYANGFVAAIGGVFLSWALITIADDLPCWVCRVYNICVHEGTSCCFTIWGGQWEKRKLMWWDDDGGIWIQHFRDNAVSVQHVALDKEDLHRLDGGVYTRNAPFADLREYRLDHRFCDTKRRYEPLSI